MTALVKICGIKDEEALNAALEAGADFVGFVLYPPSPRFVHFFQAARLAEEAREKTKVVALLVDPEDSDIAQVIANIQPDYIQLHGNESVMRVEEIVDKFEIDVIKAVAVENADDIAGANDYSAAKLILFDAKPPADADLPGGNGEAFDWSLLGTALPKEYMLSGGLTPETVAEAIEQTGCRMVDVSSGVEASRGVKDTAKIQAFIRAAKQVN